LERRGIRKPTWGPRRRTVVKTGFSRELNKKPSPKDPQRQQFLSIKRRFRKEQDKKGPWENSKTTKREKEI